MGYAAAALALVLAALALASRPHRPHEDERPRPRKQSLEDCLGEAPVGSLLLDMSSNKAARDAELEEFARLFPPAQ